MVWSHIRRVFKLFGIRLMTSATAANRNQSTNQLVPVYWRSVWFFWLRDLMHTGFARQNRTEKKMLSNRCVQTNCESCHRSELIKNWHGNAVRNNLTGNGNQNGIGIRVHAASQSWLFSLSNTHTSTVSIRTCEWFRLLPAATRHKSSWHSANCHFIANSCGQQGYQRRRDGAANWQLRCDWLLSLRLHLIQIMTGPGCSRRTASILRLFGFGALGAVNHAASATANDPLPCIVVQLFENCWSIFFIHILTLLCNTLTTATHLNK